MSTFISVVSSMVHCSGWGERVFNMVRLPHEKKGGRAQTRRTVMFLDLINEDDLLALPIVGRRFMWSNN